MATWTLRAEQCFDSVFGANDFEDLVGSKCIDALTQDEQTPTASFYAEPAQSVGLSQNRAMEEQLQYDRSWEVTTSVFSAQLRSGTLEWDHVLEELLNVLFAEQRLPYVTRNEDFIDYMIQQVRMYFSQHVSPLLNLAAVGDKGARSLKETLEMLEHAKAQFLPPMTTVCQILADHYNTRGRIAARKVLDEFHFMVKGATPDVFWEAAKSFLHKTLLTLLDVPSSSHDDHAALEHDAATVLLRELMHFIRLMRSVGLAGERFHVMLGEVMNEFMSTYIQNTYRGQWAAGLEMPNLALYYQHNAHHDDSSILEDTTRLVPRSVNHAQPSSCIKDLCAWVDLKCMSLVWKIQQEIDDHDHADAEKWKEIGIRRLANLRVSELYDIVVAWPHAEGALSDLRTAVTSPQQRLRLTNSFTADLQRRLLHPGASTLEILRSYISMIWSFHSLDHSRVLLDRISYPLQLYLCSRDDTVRIIISGLLADPQEHKSEHDKPSSDKLVELASLLNNSTDANPDVDDDWNWNDMEWLPDPVDAGPGYKRRKSADVVGTLIGVLGSPEIFIKEFQSIIGENLLGHQGVFERESSVLELLKSRFGEAALQSCEVMLRDIRISHQLNADIRQMEHLSIPFEQKEKPTRPQLHAKILSRLFWPPNVIENEHFKIPPVIAMLQGRYDTGFEAKKGKRKLNWLNYLGQATVELELEDRTIRETCHTYQASVIYAFQSQPDTNTPVVKSFDDLWTLLEMDEDTLRAALRFWMSKRVLREVTEGSYQVLERLDGTDIGQQQEESLDTDVDDIPTSKPSMSKEEQMMYWQFIQGMLKNSAAQMPLAQIAMMLKMLIAEGFPWSNVELGEFLKSKVDDGDLELAGGKYKLKRK